MTLVDTIIALTLCLIAGLCFGGWLFNAVIYVKAFREGGISPADYEKLDQSSFRFGLCAILALGFAGMVLAQ